MYNARVYIIMRASYDSIDNKQIMCGKVNFSTSLIVLSNGCKLYSVYCILYNV